MTKLTNHITRETTLDGKQYYVTLDVIDKEPMILFKEKGKRGAPRNMKPLAEILDELTGVQVAGKGISSNELAEELKWADTFYVTHEESDGIIRSVKVEDDSGNRYHATVDSWKKA